MNTRAGAVSTPQWMIIEFILRLKRQLWSQYVLRFGESVGLVEYEMISIVATATRILATHRLHPEIEWWHQFSRRMWLDVLAYEAVMNTRAFLNPRRKKALLAAIWDEYTVDGVLSVRWGRAMSIFKKDFFKKY